MKHFAMAQSLWRTSVCTQILSLYTQQRPWEQWQERRVRNTHFREHSQPLVAEVMGWSFREGAWRRGRGREVGCYQGRHQAGELRTAGESPQLDDTRVWDRQGGREGEYRVGVWAWARRTGGPESGKLLARAVLAILRVSVHTNFRNFYFKKGSPLPLPHTETHTDPSCGNTSDSSILKNWQYIPVS